MREMSYFPVDVEIGGNCERFVACRKDVVICQAPDKNWESLLQI
jgi:hypothetical protein